MKNNKKKAAAMNNTNTKQKQLIQHSFILTEAQDVNLRALAENMQCKDFSELFQKLMELGRIYGAAINNNYQMVVYDPKEVKIAQSNDGRVAYVFNKTNSLMNVTEQLDSLLQITRSIKDRQVFKLPYDIGDA
jgi:hypothetical protein